MSLPRFDVRTVALLTALAAARATKEPARLVAQEGQPHPDIPGTYAAGERHAAPFPAQLPPLDSVVDSASLAAALKAAGVDKRLVFGLRLGALDRKSTRLNSSHSQISYAVFCLKKKNGLNTGQIATQLPS